MRNLLRKNLLQMFLLAFSLFAANAVYAGGITVNVETPDDKVTPQCYFNGAMSDNKWVLMKRVDESHFTVNFPDATEIGWGYQFSWNASFDDANAAPNGNITVEPDENGVIDVKVHAWKTTPVEYGVIVGSDKVIQGIRSDFNPENYSAQWEVLNISLTAGQTFKMYNITKETSWVGGVEGETGITVNDGAYVVAQTGEYDLYMKLEPENDMLYAEFAEEQVWRVAGESMLTGYEWDVTADANKMTKQSDGTYKLIKENVSLKVKSEGAGYEYKFAANGDWKVRIPADDSNYKLSITQDGSYTVTFTLDLSKGEGSAVAERKGDIQYKYTEYTEWQVKTDWNGGDWTTQNMTSKGDGVFTLQNIWGKGSGLNVYSGSNLIKQDWYPAGDENLTIADGLNSGDNVMVTLTVINDDTIKLDVSPLKTSTPETKAQAYVLRYRNLIGVIVPEDYKGVRIAEMSDGTTIKIQQ